MPKKISLFLPLLVAVVSTQTATNSTGSNSTLPTDYVVRLRFTFKEERLPEFVIDIVNNSLVEENIQTSDVVQLFRLDNLTLNETLHAFAHFNVTQPLTVDNLEELLRFVGISFRNFYDSLILNLGVGGQVLQDTITTLGLDLGPFSAALTFDSGNIYDVLRNGTYTNDTVQKSLEILNKTEEEVYQTARNILIAEATKLNPVYAVDYLKTLGINRRRALEIWSALHLNTTDVYRVAKFKNILDDISANLNKISAVGVVVGYDRLVVHDRIYQLIRHIDYKFIRVETDTGIQVAGYNRYLTKDVVEFKLNSDAGTYAEITTDTPKDCSYATVVGDRVVVERVEVEGDATTAVAKKNQGTLFGLGSPLICDQRLYGLAREENSTAILFDTFHADGASGGGVADSGAPHVSTLWPILISGLYLLIAF